MPGPCRRAVPPVPGDHATARPRPSPGGSPMGGSDPAGRAPGSPPHSGGLASIALALAVFLLAAGGLELGPAATRRRSGCHCHAGGVALASLSARPLRVHVIRGGFFGRLARTGGRTAAGKVCPTAPLRRSVLSSLSLLILFSGDGRYCSVL